MVQGSSQKAEIENNSGAPVVSGAMDPTLKAKWVEALRSGEYEQGHSYLSKNGKYCCLGVLCEVAGLRLSEPNIIAGDLSAFSTYARLDKMLGVKSDVLTNKNDGAFDGNNVMLVEPASFNELADYIEAHIPTTDNSVTSSTDSRDGSLHESSLNNSSVSS